MQLSRQHIAQYLRSKLPPEKQEESWEILSRDFPWYSIPHLLHAADHPSDEMLLQKAALYSDDVLRLHLWLHASNDLEKIDEGGLDQRDNPGPESIPQESEEVIVQLNDQSLADEGVITVPETTDGEYADDEEIIVQLYDPSLHEEPVIPSPDLEFINEASTEPKEVIVQLDNPALAKESVIPQQEPGFFHEESAEPDQTTMQDQSGEEPVNELPEDSSLLPADAIHLPGLAKLMDEPVDENAELPIQAYHTVDYFASQGIKVDKEAEKLVTTQLDRQVKSFTEWLKTMKKLSYQPSTAYTDPLVEVQARSSIDNKEIVTEAMAEVWRKQGNFGMAAQVYAKLMLLHPEKTHYFAARLQALKEKQ